MENIQADPMEIMSIYANWIVPARERVQTNTVMNFRIPYKAGDILTS